MEKPSITIIFPNYNGGSSPIECIKSIKKLKYPQNKIEIIVVDNNSTDLSKEKIKKKYPNIKIIENNKNLGFSKAINQGSTIAKGELLFITNDDVILHQNSLLHLVKLLQSNPRIGLAGGKIYYKDSPKKICSSGYIMNKWTGNVYPASKPNKLKEPDWIQGCAILLKNSTFKKAGMLDTNYFLSFDDFDLCTKIKKLNLKVVYYPKAIFWHGESITTNKNLPFKYYHWYKSKFYFIVKHLPIKNVISIILFQLLVVTPYRALVLHDGRFIPLIRSLLWHFKNINYTLNIRKQTLQKIT